MCAWSYVHVQKRRENKNVSCPAHHALLAPLARHSKRLLASRGRAPSSSSLPPTPPHTHTHILRLSGGSDPRVATTSKAPWSIQLALPYTRRPSVHSGHRPPPECHCTQQKPQADQVARSRARHPPQIKLRAARAHNAQAREYHCAVPASAGAKLATTTPTAEHAGHGVIPATELQMRVTGDPQPVRDTTGRQGGANSPPIKVTPT